MILVPVAKLAEHTVLLLPQLSPAGLLETVPVPVPRVAAVYVMALLTSLH